jgi:hypothetical protein
MQVEVALAQLSEIHAQLLRTEVFRGYRSGPMAATAVLAVLAAAAQHTLVLAPGPAAFAAWWTGVAAVGIAICACDMALSRRLREPSERRRTLRVVSQVAPAFAAGLALPLVLLRPEIAAAPALPGLWSLLFGLAVFASRPFLPRAVGCVGLWYSAAGVVQLATAGPGVPGPWGMGVTLGVGQVLAALVLRLGLERTTEA